MDWPFWCYAAIQILPLVGFFLGGCPCCVESDICGCTNGYDGDFEVVFSGVSDLGCGDCSDLEAAAYIFDALTNVPTTSRCSQSHAIDMCGGLLLFVVMEIEDDLSSFTDVSISITGVVPIATFVEIIWFDDPGYAQPYDCKSIDEDISHFSTHPSAPAGCNWTTMTVHVDHL